MTARAIVGNVYAAFTRGDRDAVMSAFASDIVWSFAASARHVPYVGSFRGKAEVARFFERLGATIDVLEFAPREFLEAGDTVIVIGAERCRAKATGKTYDVEWIQLFDVNDGLIVRFRQFMDTAAIADAFRSATVAAL